jgi:S-adenosylmethionine/arginine decarboxylase-like enzyme
MHDNYKPQAPGACEDCDSMWREYSHAMAEHLRIQLDVYMATTGRDWDAETALNTLLNAAESRRDSARAAIRAHEDLKHVH